MKTKGFTLIELMIVVAIIAIIAAIAIPNLLRSRLAANESSAIGSLRTITSAQTAYQQSGIDLVAGVAQYASTLSEMGPGNATPPFIDQALSNAENAASPKSGYTFNITAAPTGGFSSGYQCTAEPVDVGRTGQRHFYVNESGAITFETGETATSSSNPLQ